MQTSAACFAVKLDDWVPRFPDPNDRALNELLVTYFYKGIEPEPLRSLVQHFRVEHVSDVFDQFRVQSTASVVEMVTEDWEISPRPPISLPATTNNPRAGHWRESAKPRKRTQREPILSLFRGVSFFQFLIAITVEVPTNQWTPSQIAGCASQRVSTIIISNFIARRSPMPSKKKNQLPRRTIVSTQGSVKSSTSGSKKTAGSIGFAITHDDESYTEEDSEVSDYSV